MTFISSMLLIAVFIAGFTIGAASQHCVPLKDDFRERCSLGGYNYTFPIPYQLDSVWIDRFSRALNRQLQDFSNCSRGGIAEMMLCSATFAPSCTEGQSQPDLPCQRVCSEWVKRCADASTMFNDVWTTTATALCSVLPNSTAATGKCIEPPRFQDHYNPSKSGTKLLFFG